MRTFLGILAGICVAFATVTLLQALINMAFPLPSDLNYLDPEQVSALFASFPAHIFLLVLLTYFTAGLLGSYVTILIVGAGWPMWVPAGLVALAALMNVVTYPHPVWAQIGGVLAPLLGAMVARRLPGRSARMAVDDTPNDVSA